MLIRLEHNGRIVHEIGSSAVSGEIVIGRSHECAWPIPKEDSVCSSRHAALFLKGRAVWLKDLGSTNGTFHNGKRIAQKKLEIGDKISIGNCVLCVEPDKGGTAKAPSELQILSGKARGQKKPLLPPVFTIGSDPTSNLVFLDMLVSRHHAEILVKEDASCWIRDLGSKNGTAVNGMPLRDDKERLLKDGDRIAFSHLEVEFHDGAVKRSNKQTWLRLGILAATLAVGLMLYWTYQHLRPSAESFVRKARNLAAQEVFDQAAVAVDQAALARHAASNQVTIEELRRLIGVWQNTLTVWGRARESLEKGKWTLVSRDLGLLQSTKKDAWSWNPKAMEEYDNMASAKAMLDAFLRADASIEREDLSFEELTQDHDGVAKALAQLNAQSPAYLIPLKAELEKIGARQSALLGESSKLEQALDLLKRDNPPYPEALQIIQQALVSKEGLLKRRAQLLEPPVRALAESAALYAAAVQEARELETSKALTTNIKLPSVDACSLDPRVSVARQSLEKAQSVLKSKVGQLAVLFSEVEKRIGREGDNPECFQPFGDAAVIDRALACDTLAQPLPKRGRKEPVGAYDQLFGVEEFYTYVSAFPEAADQAMVADLPFFSALTQVREASQRIEAFLAFVRQPENSGWIGSKVEQQVKRLDAIMARRDALLKAMIAKAESGAGRAGLIAGGVVARLSPQQGQVQIKGVRSEEWVAAELKRARKELMRLNDEYTGASPSRQIEIRAEILNTGLPGDPIVRRMWAFRDAAAVAVKSTP